MLYVACCCSGHTGGSLDYGLFQLCQFGIFASSTAVAVASTAALNTIPEPSVRITSATTHAAANFSSKTTGSRSMISRSAARVVGSAARTAASIGGYLGVSI